MAVEIVLGTPLAQAIQSAIQPELLEMGWGSGGPDVEALAEYVVLMLVNGKTQQQISAELSGELVNLEPDEPGANQFVLWLFDEVDRLAAEQALADTASEPAAAAQTDIIPLFIDTDMQVSNTAVEVNEYNNPAVEVNIPTEPRSMRPGNNRGGGRDKRMIGHINRAMDRSADASLHRVRGHTGNERINSHAKSYPAGPVRSFQDSRSPRGHNSQFARNSGHTALPIAMNSMHPMNPMGPAVGMSGAGIGADGMAGTHGMPGGNQLWLQRGGPVPTMDIMSILEQHSRMMQQMSDQMMNNNNRMFSQQQRQQPFEQQIQQQLPSKSLFERTQGPNNGHNGRGYQPRHSTSDATMESDSEQAAVEMTEAAALGPSNPEETLCNYNQSCTNKECQFAHSSPAAPADTSIDMSDTCTFGVACKNRKCVARHPSPAGKLAHQVEQDCRFFPNCQNFRCPFRHPTMPLCRNGGDCSNPTCKFTHVKTKCKYNPCLNQTCPFAHEEGQRGLFKDKVWKVNGTKDHFSERHFVNDGIEEEVIIPGAADSASLREDGFKEVVV